MWWDISILVKLKVKLRKNRDIFHIQIKKEDVSNVQSIDLTHLETISLKNTISFDNLAEENHEVKWYFYNGRRRVQVLYNKTTEMLDLKVYQYNNNQFVLRQCLNLTTKEYQKLVEILPNVCITLTTMENVIINNDKNAMSS